MEGQQNPDVTARAQVDQDLKEAATRMKEAARTMSKVFTELNRLQNDNARLKKRLRECRAENAQLRHWKDIGIRVADALKNFDMEVHEDEQPVSADGSVSEP